MTLKRKQKKSTAVCLQTAIVLSALFLCVPVFADGEFSYFEFKEIPHIKPVNPIYLDTSQIKKTIEQTNVIIPYKLRGDFDEADYFTSSAEETPPKQTLPDLDISGIPAPSQYATLNKHANNTEPENKNTFIPKQDSDSFFAPATKDTDSVFAIQEIKETLPTEERIIEEKTAEFTNFTPDATPVSDSELEGKLISNIKIQGLETISYDTVLEQINTQNGSLFNMEILQQDLQKIYGTGYFSDNMSVEPVLNPDQTVDLTFVVEENIKIRNINIIGNNVIPESELILFVKGMKDKPQNLKEINAAIKSIQDYYHNKGYILATVSSVDDDTEGNLSLTISEGVINKINISGNERTKDYVITRNIVTQVGSVYNEEYLRKDLSKIFATQIFDEVDRNISPSQENKGTYDITVIVKEKVTNSVALGGGIDTGLGAFGSVSLREDNFLGKAQKVSLSGIIGSGILLNDSSIKNHMNYQAELSFFEPYFLNADNSLMSKLYFREMGSWNIPLAIEQRVGFKTGIEHKVKGYDNLSTSFSAGIEHIDLKEGDFNRISQLYAKHHLNISERAKQLSDGFFVNLSPGIKYSNIDNKEIPREGIIAQAQFNEAIGISNINHTNGRLSGTITKFFPVFKKSTFSLTGKGGVKVHGDNMPEIMAYRLGGPYTIRGYKMNGVGSGEAFLMGSAELATPLPMVDRLKWDFVKKMRLTFFVDAGKVFDPTISNVLYDRPLHAITAGIGLRICIPGIGPMSIDYGLPITNPGDYGSKHGYFTFGTGGLNDYYSY